jgi:probable rRNA maturation factor
VSRHRPGTKASAAAKARRERNQRAIRLSIELFASARLDVGLRRLVTRRLMEAHQILHPPLRLLSLAFVGDTRMSQLHEQFMGIPGPTDVLTFPLDHDNRGRVTAGEVIVCVPEACRRSRDSGASVRDEVLLYCLHGMLHLCGYNDKTPREFRRMHRAEDMILTRLGVGPVFHREAAAKGPRR